MSKRIGRREDDDEAARRPLICILPHGAPAGELIELSDLDLHLRVNTPVRFQVYTSTRHEETKAGDVVELTPEAFHALPPLETVATAPQAAGGDSTIPVVLNARINELGLLQLSCRSLDAQIPQSWPLEFNLRPQEGAPRRRRRWRPTQAEPDVPPAALAEAEQRIGAAFTAPLGKREKLTAPWVIESLEQILGRSKGDWNATLLRDLWTSLAASQNVRALSVEHEETWLILAGFLLRPGFGLAMDELRIDQLWRICDEGLRFPGKRTKLQEYVLWRRVAGGLSQERQEALLAAEKIFERKNVPAELIRMAGAFERIGQDLKRQLVERFIETVVELASRKSIVRPISRRWDSFSPGRRSTPDRRPSRRRRSSKRLTRPFADSTGKMRNSRKCRRCSCGPPAPSTTGAWIFPTRCDPGSQISLRSAESLLPRQTVSEPWSRSSARNGLVSMARPCRLD